VVRIWEQLEFLKPGWTDFVEILLVAFLAYRILLVIQRTRAMQIMLGLVSLAFIYGAARLLDLVLIRTLLEAVFQYGAIAALVVFQPELRSALARLGRSKMVRIFQRMEVGRIAEEVLDAVISLSSAGHGAIIVIQQEIGLDEYAETGSSIDARVSAEILKTIFTPHSPLHDGAVLISGDQIRSAGAILPLTQSQVDHSLGTRAAIGLSGETDAIVIIVSEETSQIAVAIEGRLEQDLGIDRLREILLGKLPALDTALDAALEPAGLQT